MSTQFLPPRPAPATATPAPASASASAPASASASAAQHVRKQRALVASATLSAIVGVTVVSFAAMTVWLGA